MGEKSSTNRTSHRPSQTPNVEGLPPWLQTYITSRHTRRGLLRDTAVGAAVSSPAMRAVWVGLGALAEVACATETTPAAYPNEEQGISIADFQKGIDMLPTPQARSMVLIEAVQGGKVQGVGHGVLATDEAGKLMLYTAYHVIKEPKDDLGTVHWRMRVGGNVGEISLESMEFTPKSDSGADPAYYDYGLMQADLSMLDNPALTAAMQQKMIVPAVLSSQPNHDITVNNVLATFMADGNPDHNYLTLLNSSTFNDTSGLYRAEITQGGYCLGMSGSPVFRTEKSSGIYQLAQDDQGRYIVEGVTVKFFPDTTIPGEGSNYQCTNDNVSFAVTNINK